MDSSGDIVFFGMKEKDNATALHIYKYKDGWQKVAAKSVPCGHNQLSILSANIFDKEHLLVSCVECKIIWSFDIDRGEFSNILEKEGFYPGPMCKAEGNYIFIVNWLKEPPTVLKVKHTPNAFIVDKTKAIDPRMEVIASICYLPDIKCIVVSRWLDHIVKAIHSETDEEVWEVKGEVAGVLWKPHGLCHSSKHQSLLVCDVGRLVVLNPCDGSLLQVIPLPHLGLLVSLSIHEGNIILYSMIKGDIKVNIFTAE